MLTLKPTWSDAELLRAVLEDAELDAYERSTFTPWRPPFTPKQRAWLQDVADRLGLGTVNAVSSGVVPRGKEVVSLVKDKPLRPPTRRTP